MALKQTGVQLIAEGGEEFISTLGRSQAAVTSFNEATGLSMRTSVEESQAVLQNIQIYDRLPASIDKATDSHRSNLSTLREGRLIIGAFVAEMALMQLAEGSADRGFQEMAKSVQLTISIGLLGFITTGNAVVGLLALMAGGMLAFGTAAFGASTEQKALNSEIQASAKKDDAIQALQQLTGATYNEASAMLEVLRQSPQMAREFIELQNQSTLLGQTMEQLGTTWDSFRQHGKVLEDAVLAVIEKMIVGQNVVRALKGDLDWSDVFTEASARIEAFRQKEADAVEMTKLLAQAAADAKTAQFTGPDEARDMQRQDEFNKIIRTRNDALADIASRQVVQDMQTAQDRLRIQRTLDDSIDDANTKRNDQIFDENQSLNDKLTDLEHQHSVNVSDINNQRVADEQRTADEIAKIRRDLIFSINDLDFKTSIDIAKSKGERQAQQITFLADYEKGTLNRNADAKASDVQTALSREEQALDRRKAITNEEYEYKRSADIRDSNEHLARIDRTFGEEIAKVKRRDAEELQNLQARLAIEEQTRLNAENVVWRNESEHIKDLGDKYDVLNTKRTGGFLPGAISPSIPSDVLSILKGIMFPGFAGQRGLEKDVSSPTSFIAGEYGTAEHVSITPYGSSSVTNNASNQVISPVFNVSHPDGEYIVRQVLGHLENLVK